MYDTAVNMETTIQEKMSCAMSSEEIKGGEASGIIATSRINIRSLERVIITTTITTHTMGSIWATGLK